MSEGDGGFVLVNEELQVVIDGNGLLTSVFDKRADREVIAPGQHGNLLQLHQDLPNQWDAWDVDSFYRNTVTDLLDADEVELERSEADRRRCASCASSARPR